MIKHKRFKNAGLIIAVLLSLFLDHTAWAQQENIWVMGRRNVVREKLDFNSGASPPLNTTLSQDMVAQASWGVSGNASVCDEQGQLLFFTEGTYVWDHNGNLMPNGQELTGEPPDTSLAGELVSQTSAVPYHGSLIVPMPDTTGVYYVFSMTDHWYTTSGDGTAYDYDGPGNDSTKRNDRLYYSMVDMSLNGGLGDVVAGKKGILVDTGFTGRLTAVAGNHCNAWVLSMTPYGVFKVYELNEAGFNMEPLSFSTNFVDTFMAYVGELTVSPDRSRLAVSRWDHRSDNAGWYFFSPIFLFDFDPETGTISNEQPIPLYQPLGIDAYSLAVGLSFSADNTKLYASAPLWGIYQYDVTLGTPEAIGMSQVKISDENRKFVLKLGPDQKIYGFLIDLAKYPPSYFGPECISVIPDPNLAGTACGYNECYLALANSSGFPNTVPVINGHMDSTIVVDTCFIAGAGIALSATNPEGWDYVWNTGAVGPTLPISASGTYWVTYRGPPCFHHADTFKVQLSYLPNVETAPGCHTDYNSAARVNPLPGDTITYTYTWYDAVGQLLRGPVSGNAGDTLSDLDGGDYSLKISTDSGCDTTLYITVTDLPKPAITVSPADTTIRYGDSITLYAEGAPSYTWTPGEYILDDIHSASPLARPLEPTLFIVVVTNEYSCSDTGLVNIHLDYTMPALLPNAFSPNGDGLNDVFKIEGYTYQRIKQFNIFNRFGERVFSTIDGNKGWDGTHNGIPCDGGTYFYNIDISFPDGKNRALKGDILLIR